MGADSHCERCGLCAFLSAAPCEIAATGEPPAAGLSTLGFRLSTSIGQQYQPGQSFSWSPLYVPTRTTRRRVASSSVLVCFSVVMRIAVYGLQFYHNGTGGANAALGAAVCQIERTPKERINRPH